MNEELITIKLSKPLIHDVEFITQNLKINREEWLKVKLSEIIAKERSKLLREFDEGFERCHLSEKEYKDLTGIVPSQTMKSNRQQYQKQSKKGLDAASKYIETMMVEAMNAQKIEKNNK